MEHSVDELLVDLVRLFGVKQGVIEISRTVIEGGEQEAKLRRGYDLTGCAAVELIFSCKEAKLRLSVLDRTDTADDIGKHGVGDLPASRRLCPYSRYYSKKDAVVDTTTGWYGVDYDPGLSVDDWDKLLKDRTIFTVSAL